MLATPIGNKGRLACAIFLHGIGQSKGFVDRLAEPFVLAGFAFVELIGWYLLSAADLLRYAGRIAPRPVFLGNGTDHGLIALDAARDY